MKRSYSTDLSDAEWGCIEPHVPPPGRRGRPKTHTTREILDAIFYVLKSGCPWRLLPKDFPPWETVYWWFGRWRADGTFERLNAALRERLRARLGRNPLPSVGIADSQESLHVRALAVSPPQLDAVGAVDVLAVLGVQQRRPVEVA